MTTTTGDSSNSDRKASDDHNEPTATATADNIEALNTISEEEENEISLDGFGSASITSMSVDEEEEEEDDNEYYRNQAIAEANKRYSLGHTTSDTKDNGNGNGNRKVAIATKKKIKAHLKSRSEKERERRQKEEKQHEEHIAAIAKNISSLEEWQATLSQKYQHLYDTVQKLLPNLWHSLEFDLSIKNILHIKDCTLPFAGVVLGKPSSLKTVGIEMFRKSRHIYYTDDFTARSFVLHISGLTEEELQKNDMLPKIKNKCFLTPELAPIFSAKDDDLIHFIGRVTRVLDGHGYESDSGAHGHRGYNERMMFTWIGAAVDIPFKVHKLLTTLGPRLYFLRVPKTRQESDHSYYQELQDNDFDSKVHEIRQALTDYQDYFEACPAMVRDDKFNSSIKKMPWISGDGDNNESQKNSYMCIIKLGKLLARLRGVVPTWHTQYTQGSEYGYTLPIIEEPNRAMRQLVNLARGHSLLTGRNYVTIDDLPMVIKVVLSTAPIERVTMFDILLANNGVLNVNQITQSLDVSEHTARKTVLELKILGLVNMEKIPVPCSDGITRLAFQIRLKDEFNWFLEEEFKTLREGFEPESSNDGDDGDGDDDNDDDNDSAPDPNAASATAITKGRPKTDWNNLLENKAVEEKIPPEKGENNNENNHKNMPLSGGEISSVGYSTEDSSSSISQMERLQQQNIASDDLDGEVVIPDSIYRLGHSDKWACKNCNRTDDKWGMIKHLQYCRGGQPNSKSEGVR